MYIVQGTYLVVQAAAKLMVDKKTSNGSIINISSVEAKVHTYTVHVQHAVIY